MEPVLNLSDHDLLVSLTENVKFLRAEVAGIKIQVSGQIGDHEARIRLVEAATERNEGAVRASRWMMAGASLALLAIEVVIFLFGVHR